MTSSHQSQENVEYYTSLLRLVLTLERLYSDMFCQACDDIVALSKLTDDWVNQTIRNSSEPGLETARNILKRIDDRDKYK